MIRRAVFSMVSSLGGKPDIPEMDTIPATSRNTDKRMVLIIILPPLYRVGIPVADGSNLDRTESLPAEASSEALAGLHETRFIVPFV